MNVKNINYFNTKKYTYFLRIHNLKKGQIERIKKYRQEIPYYYDCYLISDQNKNESITEIIGCKTVYLNVSMVKNKYPTYSNVLNQYCAQKYILKDKFFLWAFSAEQILMWFNIEGFKYDYIWNIEPDVGFSGNIYKKFLKYYENNDSDFISFGINKTNKKWPYYKCGSENYLKKIHTFFNDSNIAYNSNTFIQRYSNKYMKILGNYLKNGFHRHVEAIFPEIAVLENLKYDNIPKKYVGKKFGWKSKVDFEEWVRYNKLPKYKNKFYHALKF